MDRVTCFSCRRPYDAAKASECTCVQRVRSFRCPHCAACFCDQPELISAFWRNASSEMWDRRRGGEQLPPVTDEMALIRPLVLFADDDATARAIAARLIRSLGFGIVLAADGAEALKLASLHRPDLIIADALMPQVDGRELGRLVKKQRPSTRVVIITSVYKSERYRSEALRNFAADEYLTKPISTAELQAVVLRNAGAGTAALPCADPHDG